MDFNFEDFIPIYPLQDDPDIQSKIGVKKEFLEVAGVYNEPPPSIGNLYRHQEAFKRYMIQYDRMLNIQSVGTGKTCALVAVVEYMKNNPNFKKAYILEKGDSTKEEFKKQIANVCTNRTYLTEKVLNAKDEVRRRGALTREIGVNYEIMSYYDLVKEVKMSGDSPEEIEKNYSGCIFIVDEAHNLIEGKTKKINEETSEEIDQNINETIKEDRDKYKILWKLFHNIKRSKVILATATPMINEVNEIAKIMNLILPVDMQMPTDWDYNKVTLQQLEPFFRGRISYVRGLDTGAVEEYQGETINETYDMEFADENQDVPFLAEIRNNNYEKVSKPAMPKIKTKIQKFKSQNVVYPLLLSEFQAEGYGKSINDDIKNKNTKTGAFKSDERQASLMVFPDGSYGGDFKGKQKLFNKAGKYIERISDNEFKLTNEFKKLLKIPGNLQKFSAKYSFIIEEELKAAAKREKGEIVGNSFCYSELVTGGGLIIFSKILEEIAGFEKFNESSSVFIKDKYGNKVIRKDFDKKLRYGVITSGIENAEIDSLLELFNSKENVNGDYCQILLGSESARDGINVSNVLRGYLLLAGWHPSGTVQALARFVRATSHKDILELLRDKLIKEGKDPFLASAKIKIYKLATIMNDEKSDKINSVDLDLYKLSDRKDISIRRMMRFLKQCAIDCTINYARNIRPEDKDGSVKCDYGKCNYVCYTSNLTNIVPESKVDYSTYDILYTDKIIEECRNEIINVLSVKNSINIQDLYNHKEINYYKPLYINNAIDNIIKDKLKIKNRFGFYSYVNTNGVVLFTQLDLPTYTEKILNNISISSYKDVIFSYYKNSIADIITSLSYKNENDVLNKITNLGEITEDNFDTFSNLFDEINNKEKVRILEESMIRKINNESSNFIDSILLKYKNAIFVKNEPLTDITNTKYILENVTDKRGKVRKQSSCPNVDINFKGEDKNTEVIYFHILTSTKDDASTFNINSQFLNPENNIRILKLSENTGWRDVYDYECKAYNHIIQKERQKLYEPYIKKFTHIGTILQDKKFRIIETKLLNFDTTDQRSNSKGTVCSSYKQKIDLVEILLQSKYMPDYIKDLELPYETKDELIDYLIISEKVNKTREELLGYSFDELLFIVKWFSARGISKHDICTYIKDMFIEEGRIISS
jgi:hypothetical protein